MTKRILTILLALMMVIVLVPSIFAANDIPSNEVKVPAKMQVRRDGTDASWTTSGSSLTLQTAQMTEPVDYHTVLTTNPIKNAITEWYEYGESLIKDIAGTNTALENTLRAHFNEWPVTGQFIVTIKFPAQLSGAELDAHLVENRNDMYGFNAEASNLFEEVGRTVAVDGNFKILTITIAIKDADNDGTEGIMEQALYDGVTNGTYLNELTYTVEDVIPNKFTGALTVTGSMDGYTAFQIGATFDPASDRVHFFTDTVRATLKRPSSTPPSDDEVYKLSFNIDGKTDEIDPMYVRGTVKASELPAPVKPGYTFHGWYRDSELKDKIETSISIYKDTVVYGHWVSDTLITDDHFAYIIGYPDETVRPERNITREEATMIFYRLLRDEVRDSIFTLENNFSDIATERWSNSAISTMANGGYVVGRPGGKFDPEAPITRAEFATMAVRFASLMDTSGSSFSDISGHWAENYILKAATAGWINGYPDGSFKPDAYITRAEAMTLVNNVLGRHVNKEGLHADTRVWIDMKGDEWFYYIVLEATNSHDFVRQADGFNETWTAILPNKTWK
ncbi:MAG: S-layer homology domain-containing protein [Clostridia bacterium]|nr:S-layer homology domain-containing protein [Clostridia bacterium]